MKTKNYYFVLLLALFMTSATFGFVNPDMETINLLERDTTPTLIELLQNGERYSIEITSIGCFNGTRQTVAVSKEAGIFTAHFKDRSKVLSEKEIEAFIAFELQLRELDIGGCTSVDTYVLRFGNETFQTSDGTCNWHGGKKLLQFLGYA